MYHRRTHSAQNSPIPPIPEDCTVEIDPIDKEDRAFFNSPRQKQRRLRSRSTTNNHHHQPQLQHQYQHAPKLIVESPRIFESDAILFPASKHGPLRNTNYLQAYETRYQYIQQQQQQRQQQQPTRTQAGCENSEMSVLRIDYNMLHVRQISPKALQYGVLPQCAIHIHSLFLPILARHGTTGCQDNMNHRQQPQQQQPQQTLRVILKSIVSWMDVLILFPNLKHIYIQPYEGVDEASQKPETSPILAADAKTKPTTTGILKNHSSFTLEELQLLRTYVVYRLPTLHSIDGVNITSQEWTDSKALFLRDKKSIGTSQQSKSSPDIRRLRNDEEKPCYTYQARAKIFVGHQMRATKTKTMTMQQQKRMKLLDTKSSKNVNDGLEPLTYCLLDGMLDEEEDEDVNENENPVEKSGGDNMMYNANSSNDSRRIIMVSDDAVEVKQQSPEKSKRQTQLLPAISRLPMLLHPLR